MLEKRPCVFLPRLFPLIWPTAASCRESRYREKWEEREDVGTEMLTASKRAQQAGQPHRRQSHPTVLAGVCLEGKICRQRWGWGVKVESWCRAPGVRDNSAFLSNKYFRMSPLPLNFILKDTCSYNIFCVPFNNRGVLLEPDSFQFS